MQHFYDGQIRRYLLQTIRVLSNFVVKYGDGTLRQIPVMYGDGDRQAQTILRQNSENKVSSVPRMAVYISGLDIDTTRLSDASFVGKVHVREREVNNSDPDNPVYTTGQGRNYTVERLMPTPFKLTMKCDIWTANTEQKLQVLEQILVLFNPSLELQTTDNYIDWTSLSVLNLSSVNWSSRQVPVGVDSPIDIATLTLETPIWISPPVKVKHLGVITKIITSLYNSSQTDSNQYIEGLGQPLVGPETSMSNLLAREVVTITDYNLQVYNGQAILLASAESVVPREPTLDIPARQGTPIEWQSVFDNYPGKYIAGSSTMYLTQSNGTEVVGTVAISPLDPTVLTVSWDADTKPSDYLLNSDGVFYEFDHASYESGNNYRSSSPGTFDAIIDPTQVGPNDTKLFTKYGALTAGRRYLIVEDIGAEANTTPSQAWGAIVAKANDIIEWDGSQWNVIFDAAYAQDQSWVVWQTNIYTGVQYVWNGVHWAKSFEGEYRAGEWRLEL
jgi:hypothetical protein